MYDLITATIAGLALPPIFTSSAIRPASAPVRRPHVPIINGTAGRCGRRSAASFRRPAGTSRRRSRRRSWRSSVGHEAGGLLQRLHRLALVDPDGVEPRAAGKSEERTTVRGEVEGGDLPGDLVRGATANGLKQAGPRRTVRRRPGDLQQRRQRRLEHQVGVHADHVDAVVLGDRSQVGHTHREACRPGAPMPSSTLLESAIAHVRSVVRSRRTPVRSMRITSRSSGSGQHTSVSCSIQSPGGF